ncbi:MAG: hypothetical protein JEZ03_10515, partial [Bacteroidales bacterium]|nr:hypothetical protein [Bacteroidales bacterium]
MKAVRKIIFLICFFIGLMFNSYAQYNPVSDTISENVLYSYDKQYGAIISTRGIGAFYRFSFHKTAFRKHVWEFDFQSIKALNEIRSIDQRAAAFVQLRKFVFGKTNYAYTLRGSYCINKLLNDKPYWGGVNVRYYYGGGVNLGFSIPIYYSYAVEKIKLNGEHYIEYITDQFDPDL